jgi:hypothetical protein
MISQVPENLTEPDWAAKAERFGELQARLAETDNMASSDLVRRLDPEAAERSLLAFLAEPLQSEVPEGRDSGAVCRIDERARRLALAFNHPELTLEHVVIAMTFENTAKWAFESKGIDSRKLRDTCLFKVSALQSTSETRQPNLSEDVKLLKLAAAMSAQRREPELQVISVVDLLEALPREFLEAPAVDHTIQALAHRLDLLTSIIEQARRQSEESSALVRAQLAEQTRQVENAGLVARAYLNQQTARLESLIERAANNSKIAATQTLWRRLTVGLASATALLGLRFRWRWW